MEYVWLEDRDHGQQVQEDLVTPVDVGLREREESGVLSGQLGGAILKIGTFWKSAA